MKNFELYTHKLCTDTAIMPLKRYWIPEKNGYKVKVDWFNIAYGKPFRLGCKETVFIKIDDYLKNWIEYGNV